MWCFLYSVLSRLLLSVYFPFFQCSWFSVSSSVFLFSDALSSVFSFYTRDFVIYILKPHFFVCAQIGLPTIRNGTYVMNGTYIVPTLLHFLVLGSLLLLPLLGGLPQHWHMSCFLHDVFSRQVAVTLAPSVTRLVICVSRTFC